MQVAPDLIYLPSACVCAAIAAGTDLQSRRIPNWLTGPGVLLGLVLHCVFGGLRGAGLSLVSALISGGIFIAF